MPSFASTQNPSGRTGLNSGPRGGRGLNIMGVTLNEPKGTVANGSGPTGQGPQFNSAGQRFKGSFSITGVTRDSTGSALGSCTVDLFQTGGDIFVGSTTSDGSGNFTIVTPNNAGTFYLVAYKAGSPDVAGTSVNTLVAV